MSYSPMIKVETESGERILGCDFSGGGYPKNPENMMFEMTASLCRQGLASPTEDSKGGYPTVVKVHKATDLVKEIMLPVVEAIFARNIALRNAHYHYERTANNEGLKSEHEEWKMKVENGKRYNVVCLEALRAFPSDEGFIITAWATL